MDFESERARLYFLSYGFTSLDKEHTIPRSYRDLVLNDIRNDERIEDVEDFLFFRGLINCLKLAKAKGKEKIDEETVEKYFLGPLHNNFSECKAYEGFVTKVNKKTAVVRANEEKKYKTILEPNLKRGDKVIVHGEYVIKVIK